MFIHTNTLDYNNEATWTLETTNISHTCYWKTVRVIKCCTGMVSFKESIYSRIDRVEFLRWSVAMYLYTGWYLPLYYTMACKVIQSSSLWWVNFIHFSTWIYCTYYPYDFTLFRCTLLKWPILLAQLNSFGFNTIQPSMYGFLLSAGCHWLYYF